MATAPTPADAGVTALTEALKKVLSSANGWGTRYELPEFSLDGPEDNLMRWLKQLEYCIVLHGWSVQQTLMMLQLKCKGTAYQKVQDLTEPAMFKSMEELMITLQHRLQVKKSPLLTFLEAISMRMRHDETQERWANRVRSLCTRGNSNENILQLGVFMRGQFNKAVRDKLYGLPEIEDLETAVKQAKIFDQGFKAIRQDEGASTAARQPGPTQQPTFAAEPMEVDVMRRDIKCFNCGKLGHIARNCRAPRKAGGQGNRQRNQQPANRGGRNQGRGDRRTGGGRNYDPRQKRRMLQELLKECEDFEKEESESDDSENEQEDFPNPPTK